MILYFYSSLPARKTASERKPGMLTNRYFNLSMYTIMHFIVDLSCIFFLTGMVFMQFPRYEQWVQAAIIYNMFAFALPMVLGFFADLFGKNALVSCLGCLLILLTYLLLPSPWVSVTMIGVGNGLFHIGGGRQVLQDADAAVTKRKQRIHYAPSGIFIASGAMGVYLGRKMANAFRMLYFTGLWIVLAVCVLMLLYCAFRQWSTYISSKPSGQKIFPKMLLTSLLIFLVVIIRSYYGFLTTYSWNNTFLIGLIFTLCIVTGKFAGGIAADRIGVKLTSVISLAGAGVLAFFAENSPVIGCISILCFNMTMPITLALLADLWKELPGFAFGVLMMALFLGTLPSQLWNVSWMSSPAGMFGLCMISLVLLLGAEFCMEGSRCSG